MPVRQVAPLGRNPAKTGMISLALASLTGLDLTTHPDYLNSSNLARFPLARDMHGFLCRSPFGSIWTASNGSL